MESAFVGVDIPQEAELPRLSYTQGQRPTPNDSAICHSKDLGPILEWVEEETMFLAELAPRLNDLGRFRPLEQRECGACHTWRPVS